MTTRVTRETVSFARPFVLRGIDGLQPAGDYTVETEEEPIAGLSFTAYRRTATVMVLPAGRGGSGERFVTVGPDELNDLRATSNLAG